MGELKADPGIGREDAPIGSEAWAQRIRLDMQLMVNHIDKEPERLKRYVDIVRHHRAWTLMNRPDGSYFGSFDDFCEYRQPYGLGRKWDDIRPFVEAVVGKRAVQLAVVPPAKNPPGKAHDDKGPEGPLPDRHEKRLRAIAERAPEPVRDLYREGLIGAKEAAALGPKNPTPEQAAKVTEVAIAAKELATKTKPKTDAEKRKVQREVNERVREALGRQEDPTDLAAKALAKVPPNMLAAFVAKLAPETRRMLRMCLEDAK
jgi:hypothetical protein